MSNRRLVIIDGYSLLFRAFYATRYMSTSDGRPTNALYGFVSMLMTILDKQAPDAIVVALDFPGKTFRHTEYAEYKGTRKEIAPELITQLDESRNLIRALGIPCFELVGFEADDIVGTLCQQARSKGYQTTIVTGDLDSLQLVDDGVEVMTPKMGMSETVTYDRAGVREKLGVEPEQVVDFKAIKGDPSDNIPGVPGIGEKGAAELIGTFGSIEAILERLTEVPEKYRKKIEPAIEQMKLSKWLATIKRDVEVDYDFAQFAVTPEQVAGAKQFLESFELRNPARQIERALAPYLTGGGGAIPASVEVKTERPSYSTREIGSFLMLKTSVNSQPFSVHFDAPARKDLFDEAETKAYIAAGHEVLIASRSDALRLISTFWSQATVHDAKPIYKELGQYDHHVGLDTLIAAYVLQSNRSNYELSDLTRGYTDFAPPGSPEEMAAQMLPLSRALRDRLEKEGQTRVVNEIEQPLTPILAEMEQTGIRTEKEHLAEFSKELEAAIATATQKIYEHAGTEFTIGSPKQLGEILFEKLQIPGGQKTKTGYATGAEILSVLAPSYAIAAEVLNWRELSKLKSTYADALQGLVKPDGRIHTSFNQTVAATGRLSSNDPNLQNIPIRTELGRSIRRAFTAAEGFTLASFDYSQIELRVLAHMCQEPALVRAFANREDVHTATAREMFHLGDAQPTKEQRRMAKLLNYAVLYGVTDYGLANQLGGGFSRAEAKALIELYNERFPTIKGFTGEIIAEARSKGFTQTLTGRRRYFPDIHAARFNERHYAERQAMNAPIQGTAADMIKLAMLAVHAQLKGTETRMLLNVHDELVFELRAGEEHLIEPIRALMEDALPLDVPVEVDAKVGPNWNEMSEVAAPRR